jgi:hypothetical protein
MSTIKDYSIIETEWINEQIIYQEKRLEAIKKSIDEDWKGKYDYEHSLDIENAKSKLYILKEIKSKIKPLTPIVENAFQEARVFDSLDGPVDIDVVLSFGGDMSDLSPRIANFEDYINNTIIE